MCSILEEVSFATLTGVLGKFSAEVVVGASKTSSSSDFSVCSSFSSMGDGVFCLFGDGAADLKFCFS